MAQLDYMQQEAMKRVQQMRSNAQNQRGAQETRSQGNARQNSREDIHTNEQANERTTERDNNSKNEEYRSAPHENKSNGLFSKSPLQTGNLLDIFFEDKERSLIILLIVILANEGADPSLLLALTYLIL